ncbi:MAG TPA: HlyD family efflux transporter periplasmic adaptor subunit [Steroidobacteraceae bacterium]|nr:HlyD family efflux transporter periplasmic adaptor subunit [Steroidobacteraceae bacterium]
MPKALRLALVLILAAAVAAAAWWLLARPAAPAQLTLYGNVDLREIDLPFHDSERIAEVLVQEGDRVHRGQVLARLDTRRLEPLVQKSEAMVAMQRAALQRLLNGNRPQEIAEAQAAADSAQADANNAQAQYRRVQSLAQSSSGRAVSRQDVDAARAAYDSAAARLQSAQKALALERIGPRAEDIAQARAQLLADQADLATAQAQLSDAQLRAPLDTVVRSRLVEPGDMATPQQPAFTLAITDPKWVRAYVDETNLGRLREGMGASVSVDSFPNRRFNGWVGFISPEAEFTPKSVQTTQLRSSLVYEVRIFVRDPQDELRLGMPATVTLLPASPASAASPAAAAPAGPVNGPADPVLPSHP